jgi:hypothetical protein
MLGDDISQQLEYQAQQTFRADEAVSIYLKNEESITENNIHCLFRI